MEAHPFAFLTGSYTSGRQVATQVPVLFEERDGELYLKGHIMRNTDHHKAFVENPDALIVFTGPNTYVSASWYTNPQIGSTWNYMSVQAHGKIQFLEEEELRRILKETTTKYEEGKESPAAYHNLQPDYINSLIKAIVGFHMVVEEVGNVFKLSQNRDEPSFDSIMDELNARDGDAREIASHMQRIKDELYNK